MSGEERLSEERQRRVGMSGSLRGRRPEEMTLSNSSRIKRFLGEKGADFIQVFKSSILFCQSYFCHRPVGRLQLEPFNRL